MYAIHNIHLCQKDIRMPKCLLHAVRGYRTGQYFGNNNDRDPYYMTTRSGLTIQKLPFKSKNRVKAQQISPKTADCESKKTLQKKDKYPVVKYKSMSYMSFVTRFQIGLRFPSLELAGANPRETVQYFDGSSRPYRNVCSSYDDEEYYSESSCDEWETDSEEEIDDSNDVFLQHYTGDVNQENSNANSTKNQLLEYMVNGGIHPDNIKQTEDVSENANELDNDEFSQDQGENSCSSDESEDTTDELLQDDTEILLRKETQHCAEKSQKAENSSQSQVVKLRCDQCGREFTNFDALSAHLRSHQIKQKNRCDICGKMFSRSWLLKGHLRTHTGERPFKCPSHGCDKAFADKSNLRSHMMIHTVTSKNFSCEKCGRAFAQKRYLHKHLLEVCRLL